jgi:hypothetical protein
MWQKYPAEMLRARAKISLARLVFSDVLAGVYTEDEISAEPAAPVHVPAPVLVEQSQPAKHRKQAAAPVAPVVSSPVVEKEKSTVSKSEVSEEKPLLSAEVQSAVEAVTEAFSGAKVTVKTAAVTAAAAAVRKVPSPVGDDLTDEEAIAEYTQWIEEIESAAQLDQLLFRLKFEEERENVKAAIRPVFKAKDMYFKNQEKARKEAAQPSAEPFRPESDDTIVGD